MDCRRLHADLAEAADVDAELRAYLQAMMARRFDWRAHNCGHFVGGWIKARTGLDLTAEWSGQFSTARGCVRMLRRLGFRSLEDYVAARLDAAGFAPRAMPRAGDVALVTDEKGGAPTLAISLGRAFALPATTGIVIGMARCLRAWDVHHA